MGGRWGRRETRGWFPQVPGEEGGRGVGKRSHTWLGSGFGLVVDAANKTGTRVMRGGNNQPQGNFWQVWA